MPNNNLSKSKQKEIKDLIEKGRNQGFLTLSEINDLLPTNSYDSDQIDGIIKLITDLKIKVVESNKDIETEVVLNDDELSDDDDNEITEQEAVEVLSNLDEEFGRTSDPVRMYMREMGTVELLNRAGEIVIAKKIEEGQKLIYQAIQKFPESINFFLKIFKDDEEIESLTSDYILDVKEKHGEEFKTEQIPEDNDLEDSDDEIVDNSIDLELVRQKIIFIKENYEKFKVSYLESTKYDVQQDLTFLNNVGKLSFFFKVSFFSSNHEHYTTASETFFSREFDGCDLTIIP